MLYRRLAIIGLLLSAVVLLSTTRPAQADDSAGYTAFVVDLNGTVVFIPTEMAVHAAGVIQCESSWDPYAVGALGERGLLQISPIHRQRIQALGYTWDDMFDPAANLAVAESLWWESGWWPWGCRP